MRRVKYSIALLFAMFLFVGFSLAALAAVPTANCTFTKSLVRGLICNGSANDVGASSHGVTLKADKVEATYDCINPAGQKPPGQANKVFTSGGEQSLPVTIPGNNNNITLQVILPLPTPPTAAQLCPNAMWKVGPLKHLKYFNVILSVTGFHPASKNFGNVDP